MREFVRPLFAALGAACLVACLTVMLTGAALAQAKREHPAARPMLIPVRDVGPLRHVGKQLFDVIPVEMHVGG